MNLYEGQEWLEEETMRPGGLKLTKELLKGVPRRGKFLDIGCGHGRTVKYLLDEGIDGIGVDISSFLVGVARSRWGDFFVEVEGCELPFADVSFSVVLSECTLSAVEDRWRVLEEVYRVLEEGGLLIVSDLFWEKGAEEDVLWNIPFWCKVVEEMGFRVVAVKNQEAVFKDFYKEAIWKGNCLLGCIPEGIRRRELGYFSLIAQKGGKSHGGN